MIIDELTRRANNELEESFMAAATLAHENIIPDPRLEELSADLLPLEERIRERAYQIWLLRADKPGSDLTDWLNAEADILGETPH